MNTQHYIITSILSISSLVLSQGAIANQHPLTTAIMSQYEQSLPLVNLQQLPKFAYRNAFVFSPRTLTWRAYNSKGRVINSGRAVGGSHYCPDVRRACRTPVGTFRIKSKRGASCRSSRYPKPNGGARMPYCAFFTTNYAIHGSYDLPRRNASHGCIRVSPSKARWLSKNFLRIGTKVVVLPYSRRR